MISLIGIRWDILVLRRWKLLPSQFNHHTWSYMNSRWPEPSWFSSVWGPMHDTLTTVWNLCSIAPWSGQTNKIKAIVRSCLCHGSLKPVVGVPQLNCHPVVSSCGIIAYIKKTSLATHVDIKAQNLLWEEE